MFKVESLDPSVKGVIYALHTGDFDYRYIGLSIEPRKRFLKHLAQARQGTNRPVYDWIRKYGPENIQMCILETFDADTIHLMKGREIFHIAQYDTFFHDGNGGMNYTRGGDGTIGFVPSEAFKDNLRQIVTGRTHSVQARERMSMVQSGDGNPRYGVEVSMETRLKMSAAQSGSKHSQYGKSRSEETKRKLSEANKGKKLSGEALENVRRGLHKRYHVNKGTTSVDCIFCTHVTL